MSIGADNFVKILKTYGGQEAVDDWEKLASTLRPMSAGIKGIPHASIRNDAGIFLTVGAKYPVSFANILSNVGLFTETFNLDDLGLKSPFLRNYLDMLGESCRCCVLLSSMHLLPYLNCAYLSSLCLQLFYSRVCLLIRH
jgi:hypothetical protein